MRRWCVGLRREPSLNGGVRPPTTVTSFYRGGSAGGSAPPRRGAIGCVGGYWCNKKDLVLIFCIFVFLYFCIFVFLYFLFMLHCF